jgi:hypothetical protein
MAQAIDLYSILLAYANKNNSPEINIDSFLSNLGNYAKKQSIKNPAWQKWANDWSLKFWTEIPDLVNEDKCRFIHESENSKIYITAYYPELLKKAYNSADKDAEIPFPSEESTGLTLSESQMKVLNSEYGIQGYLEGPKEPDSQIFKIVFPEDFGSALALADMLPRGLAEISVLKIRNYLRRYGNKEYVQHKLAPQLAGKESFLNEQLDHIILRPIDLVKSMEAGGELSFLFWAHFCTLIKSDLRKKKERLSVEDAVFQAVCIIEAINEYYKSVSIKRKEKEEAFRELESQLTKTPYLYSFGDILKFKSSKGKSLLGIYSNEELETWLKTKTRDREQNKMPPLLLMNGFVKNEPCFIMKDKMLAFCARLVTDGRFLVKQAVFKDWSSRLMNYQKDRAMESDAEFEKYLARNTTELCPALTNILADPKLILVYHEMEQIPNAVPQAARIYNKDKLLPYSELFHIMRKELLLDVKLSVPFWYTMPIISAIVRFFKSLTGKKKAVIPSQAENELEAQEEKDGAAEIRRAAEELEFALLPAGSSLDSYLEELEDRWSRLINKEARKILIEDVRSLARDSLRRIMKANRRFIPTQEKLNQMAYDLIIGNKALASMTARESLVLYLELYFIRLIKNIK